MYLIIIVAGLFGEASVRDKLIVSGDATATASNIMASQLLWRIGVAGDLIMLVCAVALALIFYVLLRPVSRNLALLAAFFNLVSIAHEAAIKLYLFAASFLLGGADYLKAFSTTSATCSSVPCSQVVCHQPRIFWLCLPDPWVFDFQIGLFPQGSWRFDDNCRLELSNE